MITRRQMFKTIGAVGVAVVAPKSAVVADVSEADRVVHAGMLTPTEVRSREVHIIIDYPKLSGRDIDEITRSVVQAMPRRRLAAL